MPTAEEVMLTFFGRDEVSKVAKNIDGNIQGMADNAMSAVNNMNAGFMNISSSLSGMLSGLTGKSASEMIFGTSSKAETNKVLLKNMTETAAGAESLYKTVDSVTDKSLTSMQELIPAMNAFKAATGATDAEMNNITEGMANFGAAVLAQTGSTELAQTAMMNLSKGIKGAFASLDQYGISEDALMRTGLWSGKEEDVEGYIAAVTEVIGSTEELMQTNEGLDAQIGKAFSRAGKRIGNDFLPVLKDIKKGFLRLDSSLGGNLTAGVLATAQGVEFLNQGLFQVTTMVNGIRDLKKAFSEAGEVIKTARAALEGFTTAQKAIDTAGAVKDLTPEAIQAAQAHAGAIGGEGVKSSANKEFLQDMINYQIASSEDKLMDMALLEEKYEDIDLSANKLKSKSDSISKNVKDVGKSTGKAGKSGKGIGKGFLGLGKTASEGSKGAVGASKGLSVLGSSISSMLVPLLKISVVVAVMIPVIGALAAEALIVARGIGELIKALDFKSLKLDDQINGIKKIGEALWELARTMGAMALAGATTLVFKFLSFLMLFLNPVQIAVDELKKVVSIVNQLGSSGNIDDSVPVKMKSLTTSLQSIGTAMRSMADVTWTVLMGGVMTLGGLLGSFSDSLRVAKTELTNAITILNDFGALGTVNEGVIDKLKKVSDALASAGTAMSKLGDINWSVGMTNLNPFSNVAYALEQTRDDLIQASKVLNTFGGVADIPEGVGGKLQKVSTALGDANKAVKALTEIDSEVVFKGGNPFKNVIISLQSAKDDIWQAATILRNLGDMPAIPEGTGGKIQRVVWTLHNVNNAITSLNNITMSNLTLDVSVITGTITRAKDALYQVSARLRELNDISNIPEGMGEKIQRVIWTVNNVTRAVQALNTVPAVSVNTSNINMAVTTIQNAVTQLNRLASTSLSGNIGGLLSQVTNTLNQLRATLTAMSGGFYTAGRSIGTSIVNGVRAGLSPLSSIVITSVVSATTAGASAGWTGGSRIGSAVTGGFKSALKLAEAMRAEMRHVDAAISNGINSAKAVATKGAAEIVAAFKRGIESGSPGAMAWAMYDEMHYMQDFIESEGKHAVASARKLGNNIVNGFGSPSLDMNSLRNAPPTLTTEHLNSIQTMVSAAPNPQDNHPVVLNIQEGAVKLDARNLTTRESKQVMINALEGLDAISNINIRGV